jgi:hypothetical protein
MMCSAVAGSHSLPLILIARLAPPSVFSACLSSVSITSFLLTGSSCPESGRVHDAGRGLVRPALLPETGRQRE